MALVKDAAGHMVKAVTCTKCERTRAPCPCGYRAKQCVSCCPGEPPMDLTGAERKAWNAAKGQSAARNVVKRMAARTKK